MKTTIAFLATLTFFAVSSPHIARCADATATAPAKPKGKFTPLYAEVEAITDTLLTVKGTGPDTKFVITADTKITKDKGHKEAAKPSDVKVGQWIGGSYSKAADGSNVLHSLHLAVNQKGVAPAKPKK